MTRAPMNLRLRRTVIAGQYADDDFCVYDNGRRVGRVYQTHAPGGDMRWRWFVQLGQSVAGTADTLDEAKAAFHHAWEQFKPTLGAANLGALKGSQRTDERRWHRHRRSNLDPR